MTVVENRYLVGNYAPVADEVTSSNEEDGIAVVLERLLG